MYKVPLGHPLQVHYGLMVATGNTQHNTQILQDLIDIAQKYYGLCDALKSLFQRSQQVTKFPVSRNKSTGVVLSTVLSGACCTPVCRNTGTHRNLASITAVRWNCVETSHSLNSCRFRTKRATSLEKHIYDALCASILRWPAVTVIDQYFFAFWRNNYEFKEKSERI